VHPGVSKHEADETYEGCALPVIEGSAARNQRLEQIRGTLVVEK
jgi:hypothetical protein